MRRLYGCLCCFVLLLIVFAQQPLVFAENALVSYQVEGDLVKFVVEGFSELTMANTAQIIHLVREDDSEGPLYFEMSPLVDSHGNEFPRGQVIIETPYDSAPQTLKSVYSQVQVMAAKQDTAEIGIGLKGSADIRAGTYRGTLFSATGIEIPIEIQVNRYVEVAKPDPLKINAMDGPGTYTAKLTIPIRSNGEWTLGLTSEGMFFDQDLTKTLSSKNDMLPLELFAAVDDKAFALGKATYTISGSGGTELTLDIQITCGWEHPAGSYTGIINVLVY